MSDAHEMRFIGADNERIRGWRFDLNMRKLSTPLDPFTFMQKKIPFDGGIALPQMIIHDYLLDRPKVIMICKDEEDMQYWKDFGVRENQLRLLSDYKINIKKPGEEITKEEESK